MSRFDPDFQYAEDRAGGRTTSQIVATLERCRDLRCDGTVVFDTWREAKDECRRFCDLMERGLRDYRFPSATGFALNPIIDEVVARFPGFDVRLKFVSLSSWPTIPRGDPRVVTIDHHAADAGNLDYLREWVNARSRFDIALRKKGMN